MKNILISQNNKTIARSQCTVLLGNLGSHDSSGCSVRCILCKYTLASLLIKDITHSITNILQCILSASRPYFWLASLRECCFRAQTLEITTPDRVQEKRSEDVWAVLVWVTDNLWFKMQRHRWGLAKTNYTDLIDKWEQGPGSGHTETAMLAEKHRHLK